MAGINPSARSSLLLFYHVIEDYLVRFISGREWAFYEHLRNLLGQQKRPVLLKNKKSTSARVLVMLQRVQFIRDWCTRPLLFEKLKIERSSYCIQSCARGNNDDFFRQRLVESRHRFREEKQIVREDEAICVASYRKCLCIKLSIQLSRLEFMFLLQHSCWLLQPRSQVDPKKFSSWYHSAWLVEESN